MRAKTTEECRGCKDHDGKNCHARQSERTARHMMRSTCYEAREKESAEFGLEG